MGTIKTILGCIAGFLLFVLVLAILVVICAGAGYFIDYTGIVIGIPDGIVQHSLIGALAVICILGVGVIGYMIADMFGILSWFEDLSFNTEFKKILASNRKKSPPKPSKIKRIYNALLKKGVSQ